MMNILRDRLIGNNFSDLRLIDAVNHVIDTYEGWDKLPNIANFISYDKKMRIFTHNEACSFGMSSLKIVDVGLVTPRWALEDDVKRYNIKEWVTTQAKPMPKVNILKLQESDKENKRKNFKKEIDKMFGVTPEKTKRRKFSRQEQANRLANFKKKYNID